MKKLPFKICTTGIALLLGLSLASNGLAAAAPVSDSTTHDYLWYIYQDIDNLYKDAHNFFVNAINQAAGVTPQGTSTLQVNTSLTSPAPNNTGRWPFFNINNSSQTYLAASAQNSLDFTSNNILNYLLTPPPPIGSKTPSLAQTLARIPANDYPYCSSNNCNTQINNNIFNLNSLLGTTAYPDTDSTARAENYVQFAAGIAQPIPLLPIGSPPDQGKLGSSISKPQVQSYIISSRSYWSAQSVGISNLSYLYGERKIQSGLGARANLMPLPTLGSDLKNISYDNSVQNDASTLQIEEYMAKRRVFNPDWYKSVAESTSILGVLKDVLFVLAEIRYELFQHRMLNERILATNSMLQLQSLYTNRYFINQQYSSAKAAMGSSYNSPS